MGSGKYCSQEFHLLDRSPTDPEECLYDLLDKDPGPASGYPQYEALPGRKWVADAGSPVQAADPASRRRPSRHGHRSRRPG